MDGRAKDRNLWRFADDLRDGFIHLSAVDQLRATAEKAF